VDHTVTLPASGVLGGIVNDDGVDTGTPLTIQWSQTSGRGVVGFGDPSAPGSSVTFSTTGTYVLTLTATDGDLSTSDSVTIEVNGVAAAINTALQLGGTNAYVTFGPAPQLGASEFTLEGWIRRDGAGVATLTGAGGVTAVPLITKGMAQSEGGTVDMNYFLGISAATGQLAADFEDTATGGNHPITGTAPIPADGSWHHVAASYDGTTWQLYVDGTLDATLSVGAFTPRFDSIQHAAIGTALNSTGGVGTQTPGFFHGVVDEVRIWNYARTPGQILSGRNREIPAASGLLGRWGLNEGTGASAASSVGAVTGSVVGSNWSWVSGAHLTGGLNTAPEVEAGPNQTVTLPTVGMLMGSATDDGRTGTPVTTLWSQVSGPGLGMAIFAAPAAAITTVDFTALGTYVLQLQASDGELSASDVVTIEVDGVVNLAPARRSPCRRMWRRCRGRRSTTGCRRERSSRRRGARSAARAR
jgi:concanavalin A-like lectin/glucanase superfamily protein/K319-like protein